jgi:hypothetical protein
MDTPATSRALGLSVELPSHSHKKCEKKSRTFLNTACTEPKETSNQHHYFFHELQLHKTKSSIRFSGLGFDASNKFFVISILLIYATTTYRFLP